MRFGFVLYTATENCQKRKLIYIFVQVIMHARFIKVCNPNQFNYYIFPFNIPGLLINVELQLSNISRIVPDPNTTQAQYKGQYKFNCYN